jgi:ABC-type lipopolysaccharide export system ATPase subunit
LEHFQLTKIRGTGTLFVSTGAEPKIRIIDEAVIMAKGEFVIEGQGHKMVALP